MIRLLALTIVISTGTLAAQNRPELFFREDWKETPEALPITPAHVANPDLVMSLHGPGREGIKKSHHDKPADDPFYVWSGQAQGSWAVSLRHKRNQVDLRGLSKIRWRSKQAGFRYLRIIVKLADESWLVSDAADPASADWRIREFNISDIRWRKLDIESVVEANWVDKPNLGKVDE
ncbi:MAG: hypothetical protein GY953_24540, partial [bacterium]|nr:hypothetical protein [bacterium]